MKDSSYSYKLKAVKFINLYRQSILLAYENVIGTLSVECAGISDFIDITNNFRKVFQPLYESSKSIEDIVLSSDYRFIAIRKRNDKSVIVSIVSSMKYFYLHHIYCSLSYVYHWMLSLFWIFTIYRRF